MFQALYSFQLCPRNSNVYKWDPTVLLKYHFPLLQTAANPFVNNLVSNLNTWGKNRIFALYFSLFSAARSGHNYLSKATLKFGVPLISVLLPYCTPHFTFVTLILFYSQATLGQIFQIFRYKKKWFFFIFFQYLKARQLFQFPILLCRQNDVLIHTLLIIERRELTSRVLCRGAALPHVTKLHSGEDNSRTLWC